MSATAQTLRPPSRALMLLEGRAIHELGAFLGALPLLQPGARGVTAIRCWCCPGWSLLIRRPVRCAAS
jgi:hypothetical protein